MNGAAGWALMLLRRAESKRQALRSIPHSAKE